MKLIYVFVFGYINLFYAHGQTTVPYCFIEKLSFSGVTTPASVVLYPSSNSDFKQGLEIDYNFFGESPVKCLYHFHLCTVKDSLIYLIEKDNYVNYNLPVAKFNSTEIQILEPSLIFACLPDSSSIILKSFNPDKIDPKEYQDTDAYVEIPEKIIVDFADEGPDYPGGTTAMQTFISENLVHPEEAKKIVGTVYIQFVVNEDGSISDIIVAKGVHAALDEEAVRVVSIMPHWIPAKVDGKTCNARYTIPIRF